jgi:repressor LexA
MVEAGILDGDYVVVRHQADAENGDVVVAGIPDEEATVKFFGRKRGKIVLTPANESMTPMSFEPDQVSVYGKVLTVLRRL